MAACKHLNPLIPLMHCFFFLVLVCVQMKIYLGAVVDGVFLTDTAEELLKRKEVMKIPVMMGITNHEFGWILPQVTHFHYALISNAIN